MSNDSAPTVGYLNGRRVWRIADRVLPYISGGDGPEGDSPVEVPADWTALDDASLGAWHDRAMARFAHLRTAPSGAGLDEARSLTAAIRECRTQAQQRLSAAGAPDAFAALAAELDSDQSGDGGNDEDDGEGQQGGGQGDGGQQQPNAPQPGQPVDPNAIAQATAAAVTAAMGPIVEALRTPTVTAAARTRPRARDFQPAELRGDDQPADQRGRFSARVAVGDGVPGFAYGADITSPEAMFEAIANSWNSGSAASEGARRINVAHLTASIDTDRQLIKNDETGETNWPRIMEVLRQRSLTASGGLCAPVTPIYDQPVIATAGRPVAAALPTFQATRGGVRITPPPTLADITGAPTPGGGNPDNLGTGLGTLTMAHDAAGDQPKSTYDVVCHASVEYDVEAIFTSLQFDNIGARVFPERVRSTTDVMNALWARTAETLLLDGIDAKCTHLTAAQTFGTARQLLAQLDHAAAYFRNHNRMEEDAVLQLLLPAWAINAMRADITSSFHDDPDLFSAADEEIDSWFADRNLAASPYIDSATGAGQMFAAATPAAAVPDFPTTVRTYLFVDGTFLHLDAGTLDVGVIRDSKLVQQNKFRQFMESWENVAYFGLEALAIDHTVSADGSYGAAKAIAAGAANGL